MPDGFTVKLARSGRSIYVSGTSTILYALLEHGIDAPYSCAAGLCGTCEIDVLAGVPDHRDFVLGEVQRASGKLIMICCSRSLTAELVLDL